MWQAVLLPGNALALVVVGFLLHVQATLFATPPPPAPPPPLAAAPTTPTTPTGSASALRPLLLIVVDALRDDTARDGEAMPALAALAAGGHRETVDVELLMPSTVGALETIVEGVPPPPAAALSDFAAPAARDGGWLERLVAHGGSAFVAGPDLWTERYGRWIANAHVEAGLPTARSDERVAAAAAQALAERSATLVIAHLAELDAVAHRHGADTPEWDAAVHRVDAHVAALVEAARGRAVIVVADHGTTRRGGHAGGERVARRVPLLAAGFAVAGVRSGSARPCELVSAALFANGRCRATGGLAVPGAAGGSLAIAAVAMLVGGFGILRAVVVLSRRALPGFAVSAAVWMALASAALGSPSVGAAIALLTLATFGTRGLAARRPDRSDSTDAAAPGDAALAGAAACGAALALAAWHWAEWTADAPSLPAFPWLLVAAFAALLGGAAAARTANPVLAAVTLAATIALAMRLGGETLSLSSVDVRLAHRVAGLLPGGGGILLALPVALVRLALPFAFALLGYRLGRAAAYPERPDAEAVRTLALASAFGASQLGAVAVYAVLMLPVAARAGAALPAAAAGLGGLLRELLTACLVSGTLAAFAYRAASRENAR